VLLHQGLWDVIVAYLGQSQYFPFDLNQLPSLMSIPGGVLLTAMLSGLLTRALVERVRNEEVMLSRYFGAEWDMYASKRWRFLPFIY
jgi:protein-S-isoprenylcysteine O-methyltransferase Ste14